MVVSSFGFALRFGSAGGWLKDLCSPVLDRDCPVGERLPSCSSVCARAGTLGSATVVNLAVVVGAGRRL